MSDTVEIYGLVDPRDWEMRYIGKAVRAAKRLASHLRDCRKRKTPVYQWINELLAAGLLPVVVIIEVCPANVWKHHERGMIAIAREKGCKLLNVAPGGNQPFCP
jgi:hypothetical protein